MILLTNGDSWTQGDSPAQTLNWEAKKTLDWYDIVPFFGNFWFHKYIFIFAINSSIFIN